MNNEEIKNIEEETDMILDLGVDESDFDVVENIEEENIESEVENIEEENIESKVENNGDNN